MERQKATIPSVTLLNTPNRSRIAEALAMCWRITLEKRNPGKKYTVVAELKDEKASESMRDMRAS